MQIVIDVISKASGKIIASEFSDDVLSAKLDVLDKVYSLGYTAADILVDIHTLGDQDVVFDNVGENYESINRL